MSNDLTLLGDSPFDAIRRTDEHGEYWSARDLMPLLGYTKWERFEDAIDRARISMQSVGDDPDVHASRYREAVATSGRAPDTARVNYKLSRHGCYVVAMNGDVRKAEIAAAQAYFAVKTREAETKRPSRELSRRELAEYWARAEAELEAATAKVAELEPAAHAWDELVDTGSTLDIAAAAKKLREAGVLMGRTRLYAYLREIGWVFKYGTQPKQSAVDTGWVAVDWGKPYVNAKTGETEQGDAKTRVTPKGLAELLRRLAPESEAS
jgi:DNA-damage-inducible protein D